MARPAGRVVNSVAAPLVGQGPGQGSPKASLIFSAARRIEIWRVSFFTASDKRTVRRIGAGTEAGAYVSSAGDVTSYATYGNTITFAKANQDALTALGKARAR